MSDGPPQPGGPPPPDWASLSPREREVLSQMMAGLSAEAIAVSLGTSVSTVRTQIGGVIHKLGVHSQREAIALAYRSNWSLDQR
jgi:two-component system nitrate/nitrite response regulator NarL